MVKSVLEDWEVLLIVLVALRDGAENMKKAFKEGDCYILDFWCLIHNLQLVVHGGLLTLASVKKLKEAVKKVVNHAQKSNTFYAELFRQEEMQMGIVNHLCLINDVETRW